MSSVAGIAPGNRLIAVGFLGLAAIVGIAAGYEPIYGLVIACGAAFVVIALNDLAVAAVVFTSLTFLELAPEAGGAISASKLAGLVLALTWIAVMTTRDEGRRLFFSSHGFLTAVIVLFIAWTVASWLWAEDGSRAHDTTYRYLLNAALIPIMYTAIRRREHATWMIWALIIGASFAAAYGILFSPSVEAAATSLTPSESLNRVTGTVGDPNQLAALLVAGTVLAVSQIADGKRGGIARGLAAAAAGLCLLGVAYTLSRGGLLSLGVALIATVVIAGRRRAALAGLVAAIVVAVIIYFAALAPEGAVERVTTSDGGAGRTDIWKVGWRMFESQPIHGVGAGNFNISSIHYLLDSGSLARSEFIVDRPAVAHNVYLETLAELGVVGLVLFLGVIIGCAGCSLRAARQFAHDGDTSMELISRAVVVAIVALMAADFFISDQYNQQLWILLSLGPALLAMARRPAEKPDRERAGTGAARAVPA